MKRISAILLTVIMLLSMMLSAFPAILAEEVPQITETKDGFSGSTTYNGLGVRKKSDGSITFSPFITEVKSLVSAGTNKAADFTAEMTFTLLSEKNGQAIYQFDTVNSPLSNSNGSYYDIFLMSKTVDCGFCPIANSYYNVDVKIFTGYGTASQKQICWGTYKNILGNSGISSSPYYKPSRVPSDAAEIADPSVPGHGFLAVNEEIYFAGYMKELRDALSDGAKLGDYKISLTITKTNFGKEVYTWDPIETDITDSGKDYFLVKLKGSDTQSFCPTVGASYNVSVSITRNTAQEFFGEYKNVSADPAMESSTYYAPTTIAQAIASPVAGYGGGLRVKSNGYILFSPAVAELREKINGGMKYTDFETKLTFSLLDGNGEVQATWKPIEVTLGASNGAYFDAVLQSNDTDSGFCPTAGSTYNIYMEVCCNGELYYYGTYKNIKAASGISGSSYYRPSAIPGAPVDYEMNLTYTLSNTLQGSAAGKITVTGDADAAGYFEICWLTKDGKPLTAEIGKKVLTYSPLATFVFTGNEDAQTYNYNVLSFTAIPYGAAKLAVLDSNGTAVASYDLPESKLLTEAAPNYSYGVVSDVHYNFFHYSGDDADRAFETALQFYKDAEVALLTAAGDYSIYGEEESYQSFAAAVEKFGIPVLACGGNHELYKPLDVMYGKNGYWRTYMNKGVYDETPIEGVLNVADNGIDFVYEIPGHTDSVFVFLSQRYWDGHTAAQQHLLDMSQLDWLEEQFELYKDRNVYFYFHTFLYDDDGECIDGEGVMTGPAGATYDGGYNMATEDEAVFRELLTKYRNVIFYNGHSHYIYEMQKYNPNLNIYDYEGTTATMIHVPSVTGPRTITDTSTGNSTLNGRASEGALMTVYDGYELMNGVDLWNDQIYSYACYIIYHDKDATVTEGTVDEGNVTWTYDEQTQSLRFTGEGVIPDYTGAAAPFAAYKNAVQTIYLGRGITSVGANAFEGFKALVRAELKEGVTTVGESAFASCANLETVILPETLKTVGENAFAGDTAITSRIFDGTDALWNTVTVESGSDALKNAAASYRKYVITWVIGDETTETVVKAGTVPAFEGKPSKPHPDAEKVYVFTGWKSGNGQTTAAGASLPKAAANAVYTAQFGSETERYIKGDIENSRISWSVDLYTGTLSLTGTGTMPNFASGGTPWYPYASDIYVAEVDGSIPNVGNCAFSKLTNLREVRIGEGVKTLGADAFSYDSALTTLYLPKSLTSAGQGVVYSTSNISTIYYTGTEKQWQQFVAGITPAYNDVLTNFAGDLHCEDDIPGTDDIPKNADVTGDGLFNIQDVTALLAYLKDNSTKLAASGDVTLNGTVSIKDVTAMLILLSGN